MLLPGLVQQLELAASVTSKLGTPVANAIQIVLAIKQAPRPFLVLNRVSAPPAGQTLDGISSLIEGEIQFDSYADTPQAASALSAAVRDYLMKTFNAGQLPDGTDIQFVEVVADHDEGYEQGGSGYLYRALLRLQAHYTEFLL